ncbi:hypothetical protein K1719_041433 [Acacia pycnantha]|nr:hypothetical protein K1719_041433 [Acacia pycnantha]
MKFIVWNCRGAASKGFAAVLKDIKFRYKLDFAVIIEPRISGLQANKIIRSSGFKHWSKVEADGYSGGIWIVWERDDLVLDALIKEGQFLHCRIRIGENLVLFTAVYASPNEKRRRGLWDNLQEIAASVSEPWLIAGDFNEIKTPLEQKGGGRVNETRCRRFNDWIQECDLIDVDSKGPFYTWKGPKWDGLDRVYKSLDRCLCNISWLEKFVDAEVRTLPRLCSDHHPLFVSLLPEIYTPRVRTFRYEAMWQMHENFTDIVSGSWRGEDEAHMKLVTLKQDLMVWNKEVFGQIEGRKRRLINRLYGIQCSLDKSSNQFLIKLEAELADELLQTLRQEEVMCSSFQALQLPLSQRTNFSPSRTPGSGSGLSDNNRRRHDDDEGCLGHLPLREEAFVEV